MPINAPCPSCGKYLSVPDQLLGQVVRCASCSNTFVAGAANPSLPQSASMPLYRPVPQPSQGQSPYPDSPGQEGRPPTPAEDYPERWSPVDDEADDYDERPFRRGSRPTGGKATAAKVFLILTLAATLGVIAGIFLEISILNQLQKGIEPGPAARDTLALVAGMSGILFLIAYVGSVITVGMWIYQAHKNLNSLITGKRDFSPGWAVGWFFIPIANLFKPFQAMRELWKASDPAGSPPDPSAWKHNPSSALLGWWWAFWLLSNIIGNISNRASFRNNPTLGELHTAAVTGIISAVFSILAALGLIFIIQTIQARQEKKYRLLHDGETDGDDY